MSAGNHFCDTPAMLYADPCIVQCISELTLLIDWLPAVLQLAQSNIGCQVILLDRATFGQPAATDQPQSNTRALRDALRQIGVYSHIITQGEVGRPAEEAQRRGFWEFRVTGTGKVVAVRSPLNNVANPKGRR